MHIHLVGVVVNNYMFYHPKNYECRRLFWERERTCT